MRRFLELIRLSHTIFALPFALLAGAMAWLGQPPVPFHVKNLIGILICMTTARSAAMAMNRIADRHYDALNPRTADRHLPTGALSLRSVAILVIASSVGFVAATLLFLPETWVPIAASVPLLLFLFGYSYAKRFTALSHYWLGAALMLSPWAAWIATGGPIWAPGPILLGLAVLLWVGGFDIIYACQDVEFDRKARLHSFPARFGTRGALRIAAGSHLAMVLVLLTIPSVYPGFGLVFYSGVSVIALVLVYEHMLVRPDDLRRVGRAFFHVNAVVSIGLLAIGLVDLLW